MCFESVSDYVIIIFTKHRLKAALISYEYSAFFTNRPWMVNQSTCLIAQLIFRPRFLKDEKIYFLPTQTAKIYTSFEH